MQVFYPRAISPAQRVVPRCPSTARARVPSARAIRACTVSCLPPLVKCTAAVAISAADATAFALHKSRTVCHGRPFLLLTALTARCSVSEPRVTCSSVLLPLRHCHCHCHSRCSVPMALYVHPRSALPTAQDIELASALVSMKAGWRTPPYISKSPSSTPALKVSTSPTNVMPTEAPPPPPPARLPSSSSFPPAPYDYARRQQAIQRYREKRKRRGTVRANAIRYQIRKKLADTRPRVRGRFFKASTTEGKA